MTTTHDHLTELVTARLPGATILGATDHAPQPDDPDIPTFVVRITELLHGRTVIEASQEISRTCPTCGQTAYRHGPVQVYDPDTASGQGIVTHHECGGCGRINTPVWAAVTIGDDADPEAAIDQLGADLDAAQEATDEADRELAVQAVRLDIQDAVARLDDPITRADTLEELLDATQDGPEPTVWAEETDDGQVAIHGWGWDSTSVDGVIEVGPVYWTGGDR